MKSARIPLVAFLLLFFVMPVLAQTQTRDVTPMIASEWGETDPWNDECPFDWSGPGNNARAGTAAVAMAMVMKHWNHPAQGVGAHTYNHPDYGPITADFDNTSYGWTHMPNTFSTGWTEQLIFHCGVSIEMDYGPNFSSAEMSDIPTALISRFRYADSAIYVQRQDYTDAAWEALIRSELDAGRPVIYYGDGPDGERFFVCDGYQNNDDFHINWGAEGSFDGYFDLNNLNPGEYNFSQNQAAVIGVIPSLGPPTIDENFENGFGNFNWNFGGSTDWQISTDEHYYGINSAKSGAINHNQTSQIIISIDVYNNDVISFYKKVSCENDDTPSYDYMAFYIDNVMQEHWFGEDNWSFHQYAVTPGIHEFKWSYEKDGSLIGGQDCAWIDAIDFPEGGVTVAPPSNLTAAVINQNDVQLDWDAPARNLLGYEIFRDDVSIANIWNPTITAYLDTDLDNGDYAYTVRAVHDDGISDPTNPAVVTVEVPYPPQNLSASLDLGDVILNWNAPATGPGRALLGYRVYRDGSQIADTYSPNVLTFTDNQPGEGTYLYHVTALYDSGESLPSNQVVMAIGVPYPPVNLQAQISGDNDVVLTWDAPPGGARVLNGYQVFRNGTQIADINNTTTLNYTDTGLPNGIWVYWIVAVYDEGLSDPSNTVQVTVEQLYPPQSLSANVVSDINVQLSWSVPPTGPTRSLYGYTIYRNGNPIASIFNPAATSHLDQNLANDDYIYQITANYTTGESDYSNPAQALIEVLYPPTGLTVGVQNGNDVTLDWNLPASSGGLTRAFLGYNIYRNGSLYHFLNNPNQTDWVDADIGNGDYSYYVTASYTTGESTTTTTESVTVEVLYPPQNLSATVINDQTVQLDWTITGAARAITGFRVYRDGQQVHSIPNPAQTSWTDQFLPNGTYDWYVTAMYAGGESAPSNTVSVMLETMFDPANLTASVFNQDNVHLAWTHPQTGGRILQGFNVYRNGAVVHYHTNFNNLSWDDNDLANGDYSYHVTAQYETGESGSSNTQSVTIEVAYPPQNLSAVTNSADIQLFWDVPAVSSRALLGYRLYRNSALLVQIDDPAAVTHTDPQLDNGSYAYYLTALYDSAESPASNTVTVPLEVPYPPTGLAVAVSGDTADLSWNLPAVGPSGRALTGYRVYRDGGQLIQVNDPATLAFSDAGLANGTYDYSVSALYGAVESTLDGPVSASIAVAYAPQNLTASISDYTDVSLDWNPPADTGGFLNYRVWRDGAAIAQTTDLLFDDNDLPDGDYDYHITAVYSFGESAPGNTVSVTVEFPWTPTGLSATVDQDDVTLSWNHPLGGRDLLRYNIFRDGSQVGTVNDPATLTWTDSGLANGVYQYHITAVYDAGESTPTAPVTATVEVLYPPQNLSAVISGDNDVVLAWSQPVNSGGLARDLTGYRLYRDGSIIAEITDPATLSYTDLNLDNGDYLYTATATYDSGESAQVTPVAITVEVPYPPTGLTGSVTDDVASLQWQLPSTGGGLARDFLGYRVYRDGSLVEEIDDPAQLQTTDPDLANGTYFYTVTAIYDAGESTPSNTLELTVEVPYPPTGLSAVADQDNVNLSWTQPVNSGGLTRVLTGYQVWRDGQQIDTVDQAATLSYTDTNLANSAYAYQVVAVYEASVSAPSNVATVIVEVTYPPTGLSAVADQDDVNLAWIQPVTSGGLSRDHLGYRLYRDGQQIAQLNQPSVLQYTDAGLANGVYDYTVTAIYDAGESAPSNMATVTVEVLYPPTGLSAVVHDGNDILVLWQTPVNSGGLRDLVGYNVWRDSQLLTTINDPAVLSWDDLTLANGTYSYQVSAVYDSGESTLSPTVTAGIEVPYAPQALVAVVSGGNTVQLTWQQPPVNETRNGLNTGSQSGTRSFLHYRVWRDGILLGTIPGVQNTTFNDTGLANGDYTYWITATYSSGVSEPSNTADAHIEVPWAPVNLTATVQQATTVNLGWSMPALARDLEGFNVWRNDSLLVSLDGADVRSYSDSGLDNGTYSYAVSALYAVGESDLSDPVTVEIDAAFPPRNLTANLTGANNAYIQWLAPLFTRALTGYRLYRDNALIANIPASQTDYLDQNLSNGTHVYYAIAAYTNDVSEPSNTASVSVEVPYPPQNLSATVDAPAVHLNWLPPATGGRSLNGFVVYRDGVIIAYLNNPATLTYTDPALANGTYAYHVRASYTAGLSAPSNTATVTLSEQPGLQPPYNLSAQVTASSDVDLAWNADALGQTGYVVYRNGVQLAQIDDPAVMTYTDPTPPDGVWTYHTACVYPAGVSSLSNPTVVSLLSIDPPAGLTAQVSGADVTLSWNMPGGSELGTILYRDGSEIALIEGTAQTTWTDLGLDNGVYTYTAAALYAEGVSTQTPPVSAVVEVLYAPAGLIAQANGQQVSLLWQEPASGPGRDYLGSRVYRNGNPVANLNPGVHNWFDSDLINGTYTYTVTARYSSGESDATAPVTVSISVPMPPTGLVANVVNQNDVQLTWTAPPSRSLTGYRVYRNGGSIAILNNPAQTSYTDPALPNGSYTYTVRAMFTNGYSNPSNAAVAVVEQHYPPTDLYGYVSGGDNAVLVWRAPATGGRDLTAYRIRRDGSVVGEAIPPVRWYTDPDLENGVYSYTVSAVYTSGESDQSDPVDVTVEVLFPPTDLSSEIQNGNDVNLTWTAPVGLRDLTGFLVYRDNHLMEELPASQTGWSDPGMPNGEYDYKVRAVYDSGISAPTPVLTVIVEVAYPPVLTGELSLPDDVHLTWTIPELERDLLSFEVYREGEMIAEGIPSYHMEYWDLNVASGQWSYTVKAVYESATSEDSNPVTVDVPVSADGGDVPVWTTELAGAYPNPFNPETTVQFDLATPANVLLRVYDVRGRLVRTLVDRSLDAGRHRVVWNGCDSNGNAVASGVYFCKMDIPGYSKVIRVVLMK